MSATSGRTRGCLLVAGALLLCACGGGAAGPPAAGPTSAAVASAEPSSTPSALLSPDPEPSTSPSPDPEPSTSPSPDPAPSAEPSDAPSDEPSEGPADEPSPGSSAVAFTTPRPGGGYDFVPPGDQPIGLKFPPAPESFRDLEVPEGDGAEVYLTFDDGPSTFTRDVLAVLAEVDAPAVFCFIGQNALARPGDVRAVLDAGHALCNHSRDHATTVGGRNRAAVKAEIAGGLRDIRAVAGDAPVRYYRQPGGAWTPLAVEIMYAAGLNPLRWTADPRDWSRPGKVAIAQRILLRLRPGAIVLMHDGGGDRTQTVAALRWLLPALRDAGWKFALAPDRRLPADEAARPE